ncbi:DNA polymerase III subunit gamma/tau [bacterium]|nr:MAG: DNA polymerase III subunit gamma/tau [bacterium]
MAGEYRALTRKYRPVHFEDIVSQEHVSNTLKNAIEQDRLSHAYMFCGPRGVGKTTMARVLARAINQVDDSVDGEALSNTLNIIEIDAASNNKVEDVHRIRETVRIPPQSGKYKIYIIDEVHMLTKQAFNALLKTLEEPPPHVIFIFATTEPHKVLPTILSRVQRFDFRRIKVEEIVSQLKRIAQDENITIDTESLHVIGKKADGALRDALGLMDQAIAFCGSTITHNDLLQALNVVGTDRLFELTDYVYKHDSTAAMQLVESMMQEGHDIQEFLVSLTEHMRNLFFAKDPKNIKLIEASEETKGRYIEQAKLFSEDDLLRLLHLSSEGQISIKDAHQPRIHFELIILKMVKMQRIDGLKAILQELKALRTGGAPVIPQSNTLPVSESPMNAGASSSAKSADAVADAYRAKLQNNPQGGTKASHSERVQGGLKSVSVQVDELETGKASAKIDGSTALKLDAAEAEITEKKSLSGPVPLHLVTRNWDEFLDRTKTELQPTFHLIIKRTRPVDIQENTVVLEVSDDFTADLIDTNKRDIARVLSECIGQRVQVDSRLVAQQKDAVQLDPYERFRKLQEKDPILRAVVELFGAELDYNI